MPREAVSATLRHHVRERAQGLCEYCHFPARFTNAAFHCDHILPRKLGGKTTIENLAWSCSWCNASKSIKTHVRDSQTKRLVPLFNPRRQRWSQHFSWSEDTLFIIGQTTIGRTTVEALQLNRTELLNLRRVLRAAGEHPPIIRG
jgi:hypothetical protein